ncbi:MAG: glycosyl transferase family 4 [archaeon]
MHKLDKRKLAGSGGIGVITGFLLGTLFYIAIQTFYNNSTENIIEILALTTSVLTLTGIGIIDDFLGWQHGGLSRNFRIFICLFAAIPLVVINAGYSMVFFPFLGEIQLGILYAFVIIPIGITGAATTFNFLAGYNGLEAGQGILILLALSIVTYYTNNSWLTVICLTMVACLVAFIFFNKYPSKIFPGDSLTYSVGGLIAIIAILGNIERVSIFFFIPYILETGLKVRGKLKKYSFGKVNEDGSLEKPYNKIYGLEHFAIILLKRLKKNKKVFEKDVVRLIFVFQILIIVLGLYIFRKSIFII